MTGLYGSTMRGEGAERTRTAESDRTARLTFPLQTAGFPTPRARSVDIVTRREGSLVTPLAVSWTDDDARRRLHVLFAVLLVVSAAGMFSPAWFGL